MLCVSSGGNERERAVARPPPELREARTLTAPARGYGPGLQETRAHLALPKKVRRTESRTASVAGSVAVTSSI